jgi:hypothetical protein
MSKIELRASATTSGEVSESAWRSVLAMFLKGKVLRSVILKREGGGEGMIYYSEICSVGEHGELSHNSEHSQGSHSNLTRKLIGCHIHKSLNTRRGQRLVEKMRKSEWISRREEQKSWQEEKREGDLRFVVCIFSEESKRQQLQSPSSRSK